MGTEESADLKTLKACMIFKDFTEDEISLLAEHLRPRRAGYRKNDTIARDGDPMGEVCIIKSGRIYLSHCDSNGNSNLIEILKEGDSFGMVNCVGGYRLNLSATATTPAEVLFISVNDFFEKSMELPGKLQIRFLQSASRFLAANVQYLAKKIEESIRRSTRERLTDYLSHEYHKAGKRVFSIPLNRQDLADFLFVDRSAMSAELCRMRDEGLLKFDKSDFELLVEMPITEEDP